MAMDEVALWAAIDAGKDNSYGSDEHSELGIRRAQALEAYLGLNVNPAPEGRSQVVDRSVYETISTLMPSLVRIFASSSEEVCKLLPVGPEDEPAAEQATAVVNHVVTQINTWEQICGDWLHDAMVLGNGYCMAYWDESENRVRERYEGQSDDQMAMLLEDKGVTVLEHSQRPDDEANEQAAEAYQAQMQQWQMAIQQWQMVAQQAQMQGQPPPPQPPQPQRPAPQFIHDLVIERLENEGKVCIQVIPPEHCIVHADTPDWSLRDAPYFEYVQQKTIADLRAMGLDVPDDVSDDDRIRDSDEDLARDRFHEDRDRDNQYGAMRRVWVRMIWVRADVEGDGISRLYYVIAVGRTILYSEPTNRIPVSSMTPHPLPHRHVGLSVAETVKDLQDIRTAVKRGGLDNLYLANAPRHIISSSVSLEDFLDARPGGVVRMMNDQAPGEGHVVPVVHPFAFEQIIGSLEYFDQERQNRTGASRYFSGTDAGAINKTAAGTIALQNMASMRVEHLARVMAPAVECLFEIVLEQISKHRNKPLTLKVKGSWVVVDPQAWRTKRDVRISVGVGAGNKESMMQQLQGVLAAQMQVGLPLGLVQREHVHATNVEILKLAGFANPAKFWPDPQQLPPPQPQPSPEQVKQQTELQKAQMQRELEQMKMQFDQQAKEADAAREARWREIEMEMAAREKERESAIKVAEEARKAQIEAAQKEKELEFERWKTEFEGAIKLQIAGMQGETARETSPTKVDPIVGDLGKIAEELRSHMEQMAAPAEFLRGPDGRVSEVRRGNKVMKVLRDTMTGRASGLH